MGPGPVRAVEEEEVCIFCHAPHNANPAAPLWNRYNPTTYYRIYRSDTLQARVNQPGLESKLCLSCHDGSIALGLTLNRPITDPILMTHAYMPTGPSDLTNDLSDDHPVGFRYDRALSNRDRQIRPPQMVDHRIKLGPRGELECTACHDPHNNELGNFLRLPQRQGVLCTTCHELDGWRLSAHAHSVLPVPPMIAAAAGAPGSPCGSMADNACRACHATHGAPPRARLLYDRPTTLCLTCHDGLSAPNVISAVNQRSGHRVSRVLEHTGPSDFRRHVSHYVECSDCHNPHAVVRNALPRTTEFFTQGVLIPPSLQQVPGVNLLGLPVERSSFYYEVCFRCHADRPVPVRNRIFRQQDPLGNVRREFLPTAASAHPVAFPARQTGEVPSLLPQFRSRGFIGCQDCHNNPDSLSAGGTEANGPHGSRYDHLLAAPYQTADFSNESPQAYALCYGCHDRTSILNNESFSRHRDHVVRNRAPCSACHSPHGVSGSSANHGHLINFDLSIVSGERFYIDSGRFSGSCTLTCHGVRHVNLAYSP
jgi:predicted CXXCH cytochrome family protein